MDSTVASYLTDTQAAHLLKNGTKYLQRLALQVGAQVTVQTSALAAKGFCSGTRGVVKGFLWEGTRRCVCVSFVVRGGRSERVLVGRVEARVVVFDGVSTAATRRQIPLVLSWAATVHGDQGWTLDRMAADLSDAFAAGQVVSALSRTRHLRDIFLLGFDEDGIRPVPGHRQAFVTTFVTNVVERWLAEICHASHLARPIPGMPGLRHSARAM